MGVCIHNNDSMDVPYYIHKSCKWKEAYDQIVPLANS